MIILPVADCFNEARITRALPPEHRILGKRHDAAMNLIEYLVSGPALPGAPEPPRVGLLMTMYQEENGLRLTAEWDDRQFKSEPWEVGRWPSIGAYIAEMEALDSPSCSRGSSR
jgi:hypothetical protein